MWNLKQILQNIYKTETDSTDIGNKLVAAKAVKWEATLPSLLSWVFEVCVLIGDWQNPVRRTAAGLPRGGAAQGRLAPDEQKQSPVPIGLAGLEVSALPQSEWDVNREEG